METSSLVSAARPAALPPGPGDGTEPRRPSLPVVPWLAAGAAELSAAIVMIARWGTAGALVLAALLHALAALLLVVAATPTRSERTLAAVLALAVPLFGVVLGALALATASRGELTRAPGDAEAAGAAARPPLDPEEVRRMAEALPCCEALLAGSPEERRAIMAALTRRADADAVALLRWALGIADAELAVEAALALEELSATFETDLEQARLAMRERPTFDGALAAGETVARAVDAGVADPSLVPSLAREARGFFDEATRLAPERRDTVALVRARLELAVLRPDSALACIDAALGAANDGGRADLLALREEAVLATHVLPWEGPSALSTYRPGPPPLTARRRLAFGSGSGRRALVSVRQTPHRPTVIPIGEASRDRD
jgi:hypothetical protein